MSLFRWIFGLLTLALALGAGLAFVVYLVTEGKDWKRLSIRLRGWMYSVLLAWFNIEIWLLVILTLLS